MYNSDEEKLEAIRRTEAQRRRERESGLFPGESLDLPEENPKHYKNYNNNYGYGRGVRNFNNNYGRETGRWEDPWEDDPEPEEILGADDWDETGQAVDWAGDEPEAWDEAEADEAWEKEEPQEAPKAPAIRAYNADFSSDTREDRRKSQPRRAQEPRLRPENPERRPRRESGEDLEELRRYNDMRKNANEARVRRKKHRILRRILVFLLVLALGAAGLWMLLKKMPKSADSLGSRKDGCAAILLAGLDNDAVRTDTMMLLYLDGEKGKVNLLSLPRDTYVGGNYDIPKLNSVYGGNGGGKQGMEALMEEVKDLIGYRPDGYLLVELDAFVKIVDAMGGVKFDVPQDMYYDDPSQNLHIDLAAGMQKLNGQDAMGLVRYRSGYAMADLRRVEVQRDFVAAAMKQWLSPMKIFRYPGAAAALLSHTKGDLSLGNLIWVADAVRKANLGELSTKTLPGEPADIHGGSYYLVWPNATAELVNESFNPYVRDITADDLNIAG